MEILRIKWLIWSSILSNLLIPSFPGGVFSALAARSSISSLIRSTTSEYLLLVENKRIEVATIMIPGTSMESMSSEEFGFIGNSIYSMVHAKAGEPSMIIIFMLFDEYLFMLQILSIQMNLSLYQQENVANISKRKAVTGSGDGLLIILEGYWSLKMMGIVNSTFTSWPRCFSGTNRSLSMRYNWLKCHACFPNM